jgi:hypothetical protein
MPRARTGRQQGSYPFIRPSHQPPDTRVNAKRRHRRHVLQARNRRAQSAPTNTTIVTSTSAVTGSRTDTAPPVTAMHAIETGNLATSGRVADSCWRVSMSHVRMLPAASRATRTPLSYEEARW